MEREVDRCHQGVRLAVVVVVNIRPDMTLEAYPEHGHEP
jgi:hypothetical protein